MGLTQWIAAAATIVAAMIPALLAWHAATAARRAAEEASKSEAEAARLQRLEVRVSSQKYDAYAPIITTFGQLLTPGQKPTEAKMIDAMSTFQTWATIYASDAALRAFGRMMQGTFGNAPAPVVLHLYAAFVLEARRDMGDETTDITVIDILTPRLKDLYTSTEMAKIALPLAELCLACGWTPPWQAAESV